jgi:glycosyltransferase involved in cell wall biosynthesis
VKLHTVFITYNRLELTKRALASYVETVSVPHTLRVVDNYSTDGTREWLLEQIGYEITLLKENRYPGFACNFGWNFAPESATHFHRADNDFIFLPGWCEEVESRFKPKTGQVGLRTKEEELGAKYNVGGNCVIRRELFDKGLRYDETPWPELAPGLSEDSFFSPAVKKMGYRWTRVKEPCIQSISVEDPEDPYYRETWQARGIWPA